jgi:uncharacterized protein Usg
MASVVLASPSLLRQIEGYRLTTAELTCRRPDHPAFLRSSSGEPDLAP